MTDWKVGDLAVCVDGRFSSSSPWPWIPPTPEDGEVNRVVAVGFGDDGVLELDLEGYPNQGFEAANFRKVQHDKPEACETAFTVLLNRSRRKVGA